MFIVTSPIRFAILAHILIALLYIHWKMKGLLQVIGYMLITIELLLYHLCF